MRRFFCALLCLVLTGGAARAACAPEDVPVADYIRLHVLAEDDSEAAQTLKLSVRDACLEQARQLLAGCASADEAWQTVVDSLPLLERAAIRRAREQGYEGAVRAEAGVFDFPDRVYGERLVPAGEYRALRVVVGAGEGRNWWCVLFPTLCLPEDVDPGEPVAFHSTILEWLRTLFGRADA